MVINKNKLGLTLVELLVVITIIGLLASVLAINISKWRARTRDSQRVADIRTVQQGLAFYFYRSEYSGAYPDADCFITGSDAGLSQELINVEAISTIPTDPIFTEDNQPNQRYYYCSKVSGCSHPQVDGTGESEDGESYILLYFLETGKIAGKDKGYNTTTP